MMKFVLRLIAIVLLSLFFNTAKAQTAKKEVKPYQVLTSGRQLTIKSSWNIQHIMLWTTSGHRVVEQREINSPSYAFTIPINEKIFFLMVGLEGGKIYTEKIGVQ
jgi:hypothetical protein